MKIDTDTNSSTYGMWLISTDGGTTWTSTGVSATGEKGADGADGEDGQNRATSQVEVIYLDNGYALCITNTAADGTVTDENYLELMAYSSVTSIHFSDGCDVGSVYGTGAIFKVLLPSDLTKDNYDCIITTITPTFGSVTRATNIPATKENTAAEETTGWTASASSPQGLTTTIIVDQGTGTAVGEQALLQVTLAYKDGKQVTTSRIVECKKTKGTKLGSKEISSAAVGDYFMIDGTLVDKSATLTDDQKEACIGVVFALASAAGENDKSTYPDDMTVHGYVVALHDATDSKGDIITCKWQPNYEYEDIEDVVNDDMNNLSDWSGYKNTQAILTQYSTATDIAAYYAANYRVLAPSNTTGWFLPSAGQLVSALEAINGNSEGSISSSFTSAGGTAPSGPYWSSSELSDAPAWGAIYVLIEDNSTTISCCDKNTVASYNPETGVLEYTGYTNRVRPIFAF